MTAFEVGPGPDEADEVECVHGSPASLGGLWYGWPVLLLGLFAGYVTVALYGITL
ncbi:hypothetical protein [Streptomyces sp. NPDC055105]|uniref:hypothetical protein n=1 Tax=Streptomyces sp. NPDC055105 TaxID=3365719 RepID=UPI0037D90F53